MNEDNVGLKDLNRDNLFLQPTSRANDPSSIVTDKSVRNTSGIERYNIGMTGLSQDIEDGLDPGNYGQFNRYRQIYPDDELDMLTYYVFMVKPDLNIMNPNRSESNNLYSEMCLSENVRKDPTIATINAENPGLLKMLSASSYNKSYSTGSGAHDFIPFLVGRTNSYQLSDYTLASYEDAQLFTGYKFIYPGNANASLSGVTMDIEFRDDKNLSVSKFFYVWAYYIDGILKGHFVPYNRYVGTKIADYMTSIYFFVCGPDGSEIKFYGKLVGAYPTNIPISNWGFQGTTNSVNNTLSVSFAGAAPEVLNAAILAEFNQNAGLYNMLQGTGVLNNGVDISPWAKQNAILSYHELSRTPVWTANRPFVVRGSTKNPTSGNRPTKYYLMWSGNMPAGRVVGSGKDATTVNNNGYGASGSSFSGNYSGGGGSRNTESIY